MKKFYPVFALLLMVAGIANAQCTIDSAAAPTPGMYPPADQLPCVVRNVAYDETIQVRAIKDTTISILIITGMGTLDSIEVDSIVGLPNGISWSRSPQILYGGQVGCLRFTGTTADTTRNYRLTWMGTAWVHITAPMDSHIVYNGNLSRFNYGGYFLSVINPGDTCHPVVNGINDNFSNVLNAALNVYPNPSNGRFGLKIDAGQRLNGDILILDMTGKQVYGEKIDVVGRYESNIDVSNLPKGLYTVQLKTAEGMASRNISIQ
jgi:hypothetical protein